MFFTFAAIVLFLAVIVAYSAGVRKGTPWGRPVFTICVLALTLLVLDRAFCHVLVGGRGEGRPNRFVAAGNLEEAGKLIGGVLKDDLGPGSRVFVFYNGGSDAWALFERGLSAALGHAELEIVGSEALRLATALSISDAVVRAGPVDAVLSVAAFPLDLDEASFYRDRRPPIVAGYFMAASDLRPVSLEAISGWLKGGFLAAAVVETKEGAQYSDTVSLDLYTPDNLPPLR